MRGSLAKALFALSVLANLVIGLPVQALAHQWSFDHAVADHGASDHAHEHGVAAPEKLCKGTHQQLPSASGDDCHCQTGIGGATLSGLGGGLAMDVPLAPGHGLPPSDQIADSAAFLPPLRPPRA